MRERERESERERRMMESFGRTPRAREEELEGTGGDGEASTTTGSEKLLYLVRQIERDAISMESGSLDVLEERRCCGAVIKGIIALDTLDTQADTGVLQLMRRLSKRILSMSSTARASQLLVLIEILRFALGRNAAGSSSPSTAEVYLFDTRSCISALFCDLFQLHYRSEQVAVAVFDLCSSYGEVLQRSFADLVCQGYPTALKAAVMRPQALSGRMSCFVQSMVTCNMFIPLVQSMLDTPILALLMDDKRGYRKMVEEKASREILQSFVEDAQKNDVQDLMRVEDIFNLLSPKVSDLCSTLDVPSAWPQLVKDIRKMVDKKGSHGSELLGAQRCSLVIECLVPELLHSAFTCILEKPQIGSLCSIITLVLNRFTSGTLYPNKTYFNTCLEHSLVFISNALHLKPRMLVMLKKTLLNLFTLEEEFEEAFQSILQKVRTSLLREIGIILSESRSSTAFYEEFAYQIVDTLETLIHEKARVWQDTATKDFETLRLICAALVAMTRIVLVHTSLLTRVDLMLRKMCHSNGHPFVLNRANESMRLVQIPELRYLVLQEDNSKAFKQAAKLL